MASIGYLARDKKWRVVWRESGRQRTKQFPTRDEAQAYLDASGLKAGRRGKKSRTRAQVIDDLSRQFQVAEDGCWVWIGRINNDGYSQANWRPAGALRNISFGHRVVLAAIGMPVPEGLVVDHLCRNRACINPDHLEPVTSRENVMRSPIAPAFINAQKTHCPHGHPYSDDNTTYFTPSTRKTTMRICKACTRLRYLSRKQVTA